MKLKHTSEVDIYASVLAMNLWKKLRLLLPKFIVSFLAARNCSLFENTALCRRHYYSFALFTRTCAFFEMRHILFL